MKNQFFYGLLLCLFASSAVQAQCNVNGNCDVVDLNFQTSGNGANIDHLEHWSYSHGSASVSTNGFWLWSYNNNGEGINYSGYNFQAGHQYTICFVANTDTHNGSAPNSSATFNIVGTNTPVVGNVTSSGGGAIPVTPSPSQSIVSELFGNFPIPGTGTYTYTFTATDNWSNLWFYPSSATLPQIEIGITSIVICEVDPCNANFSVQLHDQGGGVSSLITALTTPNHTMVAMTLFENGTMIYSGPPISPLLNQGNSYTVCVTAVNNKTGEECKKCFSFCIEKGWQTGKGKSAEEGDGGRVISITEGVASTNMPEQFKDKPEDKDLRVSITPNPSSGVFDISASSAENGIVAIEVYDLNSKSVYSSEAMNNQRRVLIDLKGVPSGVYMVKVTHVDGLITQEKVVLKR